MSERTTLVVPTLGRQSLDGLLRALADQTSPVTAPVVLVDDRHRPEEPLDPATYGLDVQVVVAGGGGPARARNLGWRRAATPWVSFLDDDVLPPTDWWERLQADLDTAEATSGAVGSQARIVVPLPRGRRPTDWERGTAGLETARWITADMTYLRSTLVAVGGFDERFPRAFREDADIALRLGGERDRILEGRRRTTHPVRPADDWASLRQQAGNADDVLMRRVHGRDWHRRAGAQVGRRPRHLATVAAGVLGLAGLLGRRRRLAGLAALGWLVGTGELAWARIAPGPRDRDEVRRMLLTSAALPWVATWHLLRGTVQHRHAGPWRGIPDLVLLDRDGTVVHDVPYNGDPAKVRLVDGAGDAVSRLRAAGVRVGLVTNQSGVARGLLGVEDVEAVNARVAELLGPFDTVQVCPHADGDGCRCRKPAPGMVVSACGELGVPASRTVVVGDIGSDVEAAAAAGAVGILVPTPRTRHEEVRAAPRTARSISGAVDMLLGGRW
ncbi:HAD-IIIA family hydrolase [uncultured Nocardioides sp.]|uniref:HAD-IIIA family hydrolase n=1 Tax=uncultured Nocardioides sp. TaxID=198441 RepID=UPI0025D996FC|nr:HAD-IIIA family hydrolase [uncultured Nocardioides sp.]